MKRQGNLFNKTFTEDNLYSAWLTARKGKRKKAAVYKFSSNLGTNIRALLAELHEGTYTPRDYIEFEIREPKPRKIYAPHFRDVVVQHAIYRKIYPIFNKAFIDQSFACRKGLGTHKASDYIFEALQSSDPESYTLKLDVRKFFYSIDRDILRVLLRRKIKDHRFLETMMLFANIPGVPKGIPIGNLLSQIYALAYLNPVDHFVKRNLKIKKYTRYVDDMVFIGLTRDQCLETKYRVEEFLKSKLNLSLSKHTIAKVKNGINCVGYRTWPTYRLIRKYSLQKFRRAVKHDDIAATASLIGHAKDTKSLKNMLITINNINPALELPVSCKRRLYAAAGI